MANTIDPVFIDKDVFAQELLMEATNALAPISKFSQRWEAREVGTLNVKFPRIGSGGTEVNPTDYVGGSATMDAVQVPVSEYSLPFELSNSELNNGIKLMDFSKTKLREYLQDLTSSVTALMTEANFGAAVGVDSSAFTVADLPKMATQAKGFDKVCILEPTQYATVIPTNGDGLNPNKPAYGFQGVHMVDAPLSADAQGFGGGSSSIALAGGLLAKWSAFADTENHLVIQTEIGLPILFRIWTDSNTGKHFGNFVSLFGSAVGDAGAGIVMIDQP